MTTTFAALGVPAHLARALDARGITDPFPIQEATIPDALAGRDLTGKAPTGSGKTIAFGVPMLATVTRSAPKRPKGLVLVPTRELANQVADELRALTDDLRILAVYGGARLEAQTKALRRGVDIVVACPGRLTDLIDRRVCELRDVTVAVVDEADRMADMGFLPEVKRLLDQTPDDRQTLLFSATLDGAVDELVQRYQHEPVTHELPEEDTGHVVHHHWKSERTGRVDLTADIVKQAGPTIVFSRTRHGAERIAKQLGQKGVRTAAIHGDRSQAQREKALASFHHGEVDALVATDVAARGIHVDGVRCVVHFDLPPDPKDYVHRSGRTGRAGAAGVVVALVPGNQQRDAARLRKTVGIDADLVPADVALLPADDPSTRPAPKPRRPERPARPERAHDRPRTDRPRTDRPRREGAWQDRTDRTRRERPAGTWKDRPQGDDRPARRDDRPRQERSWQDRSERPRREDRPPRDDRSRTERAWQDRSERPRAERPAGTWKDRPRRDERPRADRPAGTWKERPARGSGSDDRDQPRRDPRPQTAAPSGMNRKERRLAQFGPAWSGDQKPLELDGHGSAAPKPSSAKPAGPSGQKPRPSGAARRKAKRDAQAAAGVTPDRSKRKRSGAPRPPKSQRTR